MRHHFIERRSGGFHILRGRLGFLVALAILIALLHHRAAAADEFLDVDAAFKLAVERADDGVTARFDIAPGYHLYRERLAFDAEPASLRAGVAELPRGAITHDPNFDHDMEVYTGHLDVPLALLGDTAAAGFALLHIGYQGCADAGLCYPPQTRDYRLTLGDSGQVLSIAPALATVATPAPAVADAASGSRMASILASGHWLPIAGAFFLAGLLLSLTPCVLPMVPILSSIIVGQSAAPSRARSFSLACAYALGMALVYTLFGVAAGLAGKGLAASLQNPWVLGGFASLMALLALSMFGVYELQVPSSIQTRITLISGRMRGGNHAGVFAMGGLSALIVGPCVAAPLAGALVYISQTRDVMIGALALFFLAAGMSVPLLAVGVSAGALLPRAGRWMESVKRAMGLLLLAVAWWMVSPVIPPAAAMLLLAALLALAAAMLGAFHALDLQAGLGRLSAKAMGWLVACTAVAQLAGALSGAQTPWQPLRPFAGFAAATAAAPAGPLSFQRVESPAALESALRAAAGRPVMLDFYAEWCVACKELEHSTFADPRVQARASKAVLLRADVTANSAQQQALLQRFGLFGPPGVLFFDAAGPEHADARVIGFEDADEFLKSLKVAGL